MKIFSKKDIEESISLSEIIQVVRSGIINCESGVYNVPQRMHIEENGLTYLLMPAIGQKYFCTKLVSVIPENSRQNLPIITGTLILNEKSTGLPIAQMDAPTITALCTGAVGAIGLSHISDESIENLGIIGCGIQAIHQTIFDVQIRPIKSVFCTSRTKAKFEHYKESVLKKCPNLEVVWCDTSELVCKKSEAIIACTNSPDPVLPNDWDLLKNKAIVSVGSFKKEMQELPDIVYQKSDVLLVDTMVAKKEVGDVINPIKNGWIEENKVISIGEILTQKKSIKGKRAVFKSVGMAAFDLALAVAVYQSKIEVVG